MGFERCHPAVNLIYFTAVIRGYGVLPAPGVSGHFSLLRLLVQRETQRTPSCGVWPVFGSSGCGSGAFYSSYHHFGVTNLRQNFIGNQITLESLVYGLALGCTLAGVAMWMSCVYAVFSADKVVYLLGESQPQTVPVSIPASSSGTGNVGAGQENPRGTAGHWQGAPSGEHTAKAHKWPSDLFHTHHLDGGGPGCRIRIHAEPGQWTKRTYRLFHLPV